MLTRVRYAGSVKELVNISEQAIVAIQERDRIIAALERENDRDEAGTSSGVDIGSSARGIQNAV